MKVSKALFNIFIVIIFANAAFHLFGMESLKRVFHYPSVMTIFTSFSFLLILAVFKSNKKRTHQALLFSGGMIQVLSLILLVLGQDSHIDYFLSSAYTTSIGIFVFSIIVYFSYYPLRKFLSPATLSAVSVIICFFYLLSFITDNFYALGISSQRIGIGTSLYTFFCFCIISALMVINFIDEKKLKLIFIDVNIRRNVFLFVVYTTANFSLLFCPSEYQILTGLLLNISFAMALYIMIFKPLIQKKDQNIVICSWTKKIKTKSGEWVDHEELLKDIGFSITHGLCPEHKEKMINELKK